MNIPLNPELKNQSSSFSGRLQNIKENLRREYSPDEKHYFQNELSKVKIYNLTGVRLYQPLVSAVEHLAKGVFKNLIYNTLLLASFWGNEGSVSEKMIQWIQEPFRAVKNISKAALMVIYSIPLTFSIGLAALFTNRENADQFIVDLSDFERSFYGKPLSVKDLSERLGLIEKEIKEGRATSENRRQLVREEFVEELGDFSKEDPFSPLNIINPQGEVVEDSAQVDRFLETRKKADDVSSDTESFNPEEFSDNDSILSDDEYNAFDIEYRWETPKSGNEINQTKSQVSDSQ